MTDILMPRLSDTMEEGVISRWNVKVGDEVTKGDILGEIETDKATMDFEAYDTGVVSSLLVEEGATVAIGERVAVLGEDAGDSGGSDDSDEPEEGEESEDTGEPAAGEESGDDDESGDSEESADSVSTSEESDEEESSQTEASSTKSQGSDGTAVRISPLARKMAEKHDIDAAEIEGTGPRGRIIRVDVEKAISESGESGDDGQADRIAQKESSAQRESSEDTTVSLNANQRVTAERLSDSAGVPTFRLTSKVEADALMAFRAEINERLAATGDKISLTDLLTRACAVMLRAHPEVNASWNGDSIIRRGAVNIGIAVALDSGLIVPVITDADHKSVSQIGRESRDLADRAKSGKLHPDEFTGGTFSISNLGMYGIDDFTAIINPPEAAILSP
jgi:pyruvate dehydrogenase E2 component (dihydrolipoamide acetyltransferase)